MIKQRQNPAIMGSARVNVKEREKNEKEGRRAKKKKGVKAQKVKPPALTRAIDALIGEELENENEKKEQRERKREPVSNPVTPDHLVASYDPQGSYSELILLHPPNFY